jgi:hypothetical protein
MKIPYVKVPNKKCIAAIVVVPAVAFGIEKLGFIKSSSHFVVMIAWEWESAAKEGRFKCYKKIVDEITDDTISATADYGQAMTDEEINKWFPFLLK